jgi:hypothetical protein
MSEFITREARRARRSELRAAAAESARLLKSRARKWTLVEYQERARTARAAAEADWDRREVQVLPSRPLYPEEIHENREALRRMRADRAALAPQVDLVRKERYKNWKPWAFDRVTETLKTGIEAFTAAFLGVGQRRAQVRQRERKLEKKAALRARQKQLARKEG